MGKLSQDKFVCQLTTPLGADVLCLESFTAHEALGEPFEIQVSCVSEQENIDFNKVLGQACSIKLKTYEQKERFFCGILTNAQWAGSERGGDQELSKYHLVLRPWFSLLNHSANCRIFLDKNVKEIIEKVFTDLGFSSGTDFEFRTTANYDDIKSKYCVQYRESDFAFVSRLMEQYGIYYYFEHKDKQHTMVLADSYSSHKPIPDLKEVNFNGQVEGHNRNEQQIHSWVSDRRFCTGTFALNDYDYLQPTQKLRASRNASRDYVRSLWEVYDYPGKYDAQAKGERFAQFRLEAEQALDHRRSTVGDAPSMFAGGRVTVQRHPTKNENQEYLVLQASHQYGIQSYGSSAGAATYRGQYQFLPADRPFRSVAVTPKPRIHGIQTAKVVTKKGEDDEEISTDEHGHIWVQFHWERENPLAREEEDREPKKSCPVRVAQPWAGKRWGHQFIPRVGMEVVVEFLEGDPDRPLVIGCVYNGVNTTPSELPLDKNWSGVKSDSTKGHHGHNYIIFNDTKGEENLYLVAEKNHEVKVRDSETRVIGKNRAATLEEGDDRLEVKGGGVTIKVHDNIDTNAGKSVVTTANQKNSLIVEDTYVALDSRTISMDTTQINISAPLVRIKGDVVITGKLFVDAVIAGAAWVGGKPV